MPSLIQRRGEVPGSNCKKMDFSKFKIRSTSSSFLRVRLLFHLKYLALSLTMIATPFLIFFYYANYDVLVDNWCWDEHFKVLHSSSNGNNKINVIPSSVKEAPINSVATIPKSFYIEESSFCKKMPNLKILAYVHSAIMNTEERNITRSTWANVSSEVGTVFFVGKSKDDNEKKIVERESKMYGDIIQGNYTDMYELLVYKALNALYWITKNCASVPWVLHADDDILLDVNYLLKVLDAFELDKRTNEIFCHTFVRAPARRSDKWRVNTKEYPCKYYPPYCSGPCWFTTSKVIRKLLDGVSKTRYLWVDDTYLTGLVAEVTNIKRSEVPMVNHYLKDHHLGYVIAWLNVEEDRLKAWQNILRYNNFINNDNNNKNNNILNNNNNGQKT